MNLLSKLLFLFLAATTSLSGSDNNLLKPKVKLIYSDPLSKKPIIITLDMLSISYDAELPQLRSEFFVSFRPNFALKEAQGKKGILVPNLAQVAGLGHLVGLPTISPYGYVGCLCAYKYRLALISMTPAMEVRVMPMRLKKALAEQLSLSEDNLFHALQKLNTTFDAMILSDNLTEKRELPPDKIYNIRFHYWVAGWHRPETYPLEDFNEAVAMGIFKPRFVEQLVLEPLTAIAFNSLKPQHVHYHSALSPNNARFRINTDHPFSSFWLAAVSPDKKSVSITYLLITNTPKAKRFMLGVLENAGNIQELAAHIHKALESAQWESDDKKVVKEWIDTVVTAVSVDPIENLNKLSQQLRALRRLL